MPGYGQSLGAALGQLAFGGGDPMNTKSGMKGMLDGAHAGAYEANAKQSLAQALKAEADAANTAAQTGILTGRGANVDLTMAAESGVPLPQINAYRDYLKTGVKPMSSATGDMQTDEAIGIAPAPSFDNGVMAKLAPLMKRNLPYLTNVGDIKIDDAAQADATYNTTGLINRVAGGGKQGDAVRALLAAKGKAEFDNLGGNGVFSGVDGGQQLNAVGTSAAGENVARAGSANASAANSYASAGQHKASTDKIRQEITQGGKSGQTQIITDAAGNVTLVDKVTGMARPATYADGQTVGAKVGGKSDKPLTEGQAKAVAFASRMENSISIVNDLAAGGVNKSIPGSRAGYGVGSVVNMMQPEARQQLDQAKRDFINANLRRESGAVISDPEFSNAELQYFPQPGDGPKVIAQKATNRKIALEGMKADIPANMGDATGNIIRKASGAPASNIDALLNKYK